MMFESINWTEISWTYLTIDSLAMCTLYVEFQTFVCTKMDVTNVTLEIHLFFMLDPNMRLKSVPLKCCKAAVSALVWFCSFMNPPDMHLQFCSPASGIFSAHKEHLLSFIWSWIALMWFFRFSLIRVEKSHLLQSYLIWAPSFLCLALTWIIRFCLDVYCALQASHLNVVSFKWTIFTCMDKYSFRANT